MDTTIDSLQIEINSSSVNASKALDTLYASLNKLKSIAKGGAGLTTVANQIQKLSTALTSASVPTQKIAQIAAALKPLELIGKTNLGSTLAQLKKLPEITNALSKIDMSKFASQIAKVTTAIQPLANEMAKVSAGFSALPTKLQRIIQSTDRLSTSNKKAKSSYGILGTGISSFQAKLGIAYIALRRVAGYVAGWVNESNNYVENLNLFTVAMGKYADSALEYANQVKEALGIDPSEFIRNWGIFKQILSGFGVIESTAYTMSKGLNQVSYDIASFFNISIEDAMQKVQSGISGELEPLELAA